MGKLVWKLRYIIIGLTILFFHESYFVNHRKLYVAILFASIGGLIFSLLYLIFNYVLFSNIFAYVSGIVNRKRIDTISKYLESNGITPQIKHCRLEFAIKQQKTSITVWGSTIEVFFEYDNPSKGVPFYLKQEFVKEVVPFEYGALFLIKKRASDDDIFNLIYSGIVK